MPSAKKKKSAKKKQQQQLGILTHPATGHQTQEGSDSNGAEEDVIGLEEKDTEISEEDSGTAAPPLPETEKSIMENGSEKGAASEERESDGQPVEIEKGFQSRSVSDEQETLTENPAGEEEGEPVSVVRITDPTGDSLQGGVSVAEEAKSLEEEGATEEIPIVSSDAEAVPVEKVEVTEVAETDLIQNIGVAQLSEDGFVENTEAVPEIGSQPVEIEEKTTHLPPEPMFEADSQYAKNDERTAHLSSQLGDERSEETLQSRNEREIPVSTNTEDQPIVAPIMPAHSTWKSCCGLFDLFGGTNR